MSRVLGFTMLVAVIDVVLITAIATLGGVPLQHGGRRCSAASRSPSPRTSADASGLAGPAVLGGRRRLR